MKLLTDDEVSILLHENTYLTDGDFARAIQLALIEKIRKEPVAVFWITGAIANDCPPISFGHGYKLRMLAKNDNQPLFTLPTEQELENE